MQDGGECGDNRGRNIINQETVAANQMPVPEWGERDESEIYSEG